MTEKELVEKLLRDRAIVKSDNTLDKMRYMKLITEPWIRKRVETYGWLKQPICAVEKTADLNAENKPVDETFKTVEKVPQIENKAPENVELTPTVPEQVKPVEEKVAEELVEEKVAEEHVAEEIVEENNSAPATEEVVVEETTETDAPKKTRKKKN